MQSYDEIFASRGSAYDLAMREFPDARAEEFRQAVAAASPMPGMSIADVPAGGGYLRRYLPDGCQWLPHEPCVTFTRHHAASSDPGNTSLLPLPWETAAIDAAISVAGVHHIDDKRPLFAELARVVRPGGRLALSDVASGSAVSRFLDTYVGANNSTGHEGVYLDSHTLEELTESGWTVEGWETVRYRWTFPDAEAMARFCHGLFDICKAPLAETAQALDRYLGHEATAAGVGLNWSLMTIAAVRNRVSA